MNIARIKQLLYILLAATMIMGSEGCYMHEMRYQSLLPPDKPTPRQIKRQQKRDKNPRPPFMGTGKCKPRTYHNDANGRCVCYQGCKFHIFWIPLWGTKEMPVVLTPAERPCPEGDMQLKVE